MVSFSFRFSKKLDSEKLEAQLLRKERSSGAEYRAILVKLNGMLIDINAHLESGHRYYNSLFEKSIFIIYSSDF